LFQERARRRVVVDDERTEAGRRRRHAPPRTRAVGDEPDGEPERRPAPGLARDADLPAHQPDELLADRQPEPGAAELPRRRAVALRKRLEEPRGLLGRDADARVRDLDVHDDPAGPRAPEPRTHDDLAL